MTVALGQPMTTDEFLAWEERQDLRHEFDGFAPVAMTGGTFEHDAIQVNLVRALANRLASTPCRAHGNSLKVEVAGSICYPDAFVTCGPTPSGSTVLRDPVVVFEVLSRDIARADRMVKNREYAATGFVQRYILAEGDVIAMPAIGIAGPLAELYKSVDVSAPPADEDG